MSVPVSLASWAIRHHVSQEALAELRTMMAAQLPQPGEPKEQQEAWAQSAIRLEAAQKGVYLWRNNVGALKDERGIPVRYGLANDNAQVNRRLKSSDLIGVRPLVIQAHMVGQTVGQFVAREVKKPGWVYRGDDREVAQATFIHLVQSVGGDAAFATGPGTL